MNNIQQLQQPKSEQEFRLIQDNLYEVTRKHFIEGKDIGFTGLKEIAFSEPVIVTAIHKLKANAGSNTPGVDGETMRKDFLELNYEETINKVKEAVINYKPSMIKRAYIPKATGGLRPLGMPVTIEKIIEECIRSTIEPILEAQFFDHSYGFRPLRDCHMAINRVKDLMWKTGHTYVVEGDITKFFDNVNHRILIKSLFHMGIRDKRILMIIKQMLKAGIMNEVNQNDLGIPQGAILSPLLANVYLNNLDHFITREWEEKRWKKITRYYKDGTKTNGTTMRNKNFSNLKPAYLIRFADDWVLITNSYKNALKFRYRIKKFLKEQLKLELSEEKTKITNALKKSIHFLGVEIKVYKGKSRSGIITRSKPNRMNLKKKIKDLHDEARKLKSTSNIKKLIHRINKLNSIILGLINYYSITSNVNVEFRKYSYNLNRLIRKMISKSLDKRCMLIPAQETTNLKNIHKNHREKIPAVKYRSTVIGVTSLNFATYKRGTLKNPSETVYTEKGRELYKERLNKYFSRNRPELSTTLELSEHISNGTQENSKLYNFEYFMNRCYALNRDRHKCRICHQYLIDKIHTHHINPNLSIDKVNRVNNLASTHRKCHILVHSNKIVDNKEIMKRVLRFREKLKLTA